MSSSEEDIASRREDRREEQRRSSKSEDSSKDRRRSSMFSRLFSKDGKKKKDKSVDNGEKESEKDRKKQVQRSKTISSTDEKEAAKEAARDGGGSSAKKDGAGGGEHKAEKPRPRKPETVAKTPTRKGGSKKKERKVSHAVDISKPIPFPCTPETIIDYHKLKPFLSSNEEWLIMELNEFECLVDSLDIIKVIAQHSKFFEVDPDELWTEFFEFVEEMPSYDEVINYDVWQEFRDTKYPC